MDEEVFPVCSPGFYQKYRHLLKYVENLLNLPLIHDLTLDVHTGFTTWNTWLRVQSGEQWLGPARIKINNSAAVLQAAIDGAWGRIGKKCYGGR